MLPSHMINDLLHYRAIGLDETPRAKKMSRSVDDLDANNQRELNLLRYLRAEGFRLTTLTLHGASIDLLLLNHLSDIGFQVEKIVFYKCDPLPILGHRYLKVSRGSKPNRTTLIKGISRQLELRKRCPLLTTVSFPSALTRFKLVDMERCPFFRKLIITF
jgi:hypothetical protein